MAHCGEIEVYKPTNLDERLKEEQEVLEGYFYPEKYPMLYKDATPCFEQEVTIKEDRSYTLRVYVNSHYPKRMPNLVVCISPEPMPDWNGSHHTHTYQRMHGFLHICHWHWAAWKTENMIYQVFEKGKEWLEAYEKYLITGKPLELEQMELTEEETQRVIERQLQQRVLTQQWADYQMYQLHLKFLNQLWKDIWFSFGITSDILSQNNLPVVPDITVDDERYMQRPFSGDEYALQRINEGPGEKMLAQLIRLASALKECKAVWPNWLIVVLKFLSTWLMMELHRYWRNMYIGGPRSLQNN